MLIEAGLANRCRLVMPSVSKGFLEEPVKAILHIWL